MKLKEGRFNGVLVMQFFCRVSCSRSKVLVSNYDWDRILKMLENHPLLRAASIISEEKRERHLNRPFVVGIVVRMRIFSIG